MIRLIPYIIYLLIIAMHEVIWRDVTGLYFFALNLPALIVVSVAIYKPEFTAIWFGFLAGIVLAASQPEKMGWHALILAAIGGAVFHVRNKLNLESIYSKILLIIGAVLVHNIASVIISGTDRFFYTFWTYCLPSTAYSTLVAWIFFLFKERRITSQKVRSVF